MLAPKVNADVKLTVTSVGGRYPHIMLRLDNDVEPQEVCDAEPCVAVLLKAL